MALTIRCNVCGSNVPFTEDDRGGEVYCLSCGRTCSIPESEPAPAPPKPVVSAPPPPAVAPPKPAAAPSPPAAAPRPPAPAAAAPAAPRPQAPPPPRPAAPVKPAPTQPAPVPVAAARSAPPSRPPAFRKVQKVFGKLDLSDRKVGQVMCFCRPENPLVIPVTVADYANGSVFCPSCGAGVPVGESLQKFAAAQASDGMEEAANLPAPRPRFRLFQSPVGVAALLLVGGAFVLGGYWTWRNEALPEIVGNWFWRREGGPGEAKIEPKEAPPRLTQFQQVQLSMVLAASPSSPLAVLGALSLRPQDLRPAARPGELTIEQIEQLLQQTDVRAALVQAQVWKQMLIDQGVSRSDPRRLRLEEVIKLLTEKLAPAASGPPPYVAEFRKLVQELREALAKEDLKAARPVGKKAEELYLAHPQELAPYSHSYLLLQAKLRELAALVEGLRNVETLLGQAFTLAQQGRAGEAVECESRAKFLALRTPMTTADEERLNQLARKLTPELLLARGKRAVQEANRCLTEGDGKTRDLLVQEARTYLPGLPDNQVRDLLAEADKTAKAPVERASGSAFGQAIAFRRLYEQALERYAVGDVAQTLAVAADAARVLAGMSAPGDRAKKLSERVFEILDVTVMEGVSLSDSHPGLQARLLDLRKALDSGAPWHGDERWKKLDGVVRSRGDRFARTALDRAQGLADKDQLAEAIVVAEPARTLGAPETVKKAQELITRWQEEQKQRASLAAQEQHWKEIERLQAENKVLEARAEVERFLKRYPESPRLKQAKALEAQLAAQVEKPIQEKLLEMDRCLKEQKWADFRRQYQLLRSQSLPAKYDPDMKRFQSTIENLNIEADGRFSSLQRQYGRLLSPFEVLKLLEELPEVLARNPDHAEAKALLEEAKRRGRAYADGLLGTARALKKFNPEKYKQRLQEISRLDPDEGQSGQKARELLKELDRS